MTGLSSIVCENIDNPLIVHRTPKSEDDVSKQAVGGASTCPPNPFSNITSRTREWN